MTANDHASAHSFLYRDGPPQVPHEFDHRPLQLAIDKYSLHDINAGTTGSTGGES